MVLYKTAQHVSKAKVAVEVREEEGTEDVVEAEIVGRASLWPRVVRESILQVGIEEPRAKIARIEKWF